MGKYSEIVKNICSTFEDNLDCFPARKRFHWSVRRYRITGDVKYISKIEESFRKLSGDIFSNASIFSNPQHYGSEALEKLDKLVKVSGEVKKRKERKHAFYRKNPEIYFWKKSFLNMFLVKSFSLDKDVDFEEYFKLGIEALKKRDWEKVIFETNYIDSDPSEAVNLVFYLKFLGIADFEEKILQLYLRKIKAGVVNGVTLWKDLVYGLTHIIIASSFYYQRFVEKEKYSFILDFFGENIKDIIKFTSPDVVAEVGICFLLAKDKRVKTLDLIKEYIVSKFDEEISYIPVEIENSIERAEHRNIIAVMLLSEWNELYPGPNMS